MSLQGNNVVVDTRAGAILGRTVTGILEGSSVSYHVAKTFDPELHVLHNQIFPYLDESQRVELTQDTYLLIRVNDRVKVYAQSWLVMSTLAATGPTKVQVMLLGPVDQNRLRELLTVNGFDVESMGEVQ